MIHFRHRWAIEKRVVAGPLAPDRIENVSPETIQRMVLGITTYIFQCRICNAVKIVECLGRETPEKGGTP